MKRALQKLVRNGNSTQVAIARPLLIDLGWLPGEFVIVELQPDNTLRIVRPNVEDVTRGNSHTLIPEPAAGVPR